MMVAPPRPITFLSIRITPRAVARRRDRGEHSGAAAADHQNVALQCNIVGHAECLNAGGLQAACLVFGDRFEECAAV